MRTKRNLDKWEKEELDLKLWVEQQMTERAKSEQLYFEELKKRELEQAKRKQKLLA